MARTDEIFAFMCKGTYCAVRTQHEPCFNCIESQSLIHCLLHWSIRPSPRVLSDAFGASHRIGPSDCTKTSSNQNDHRRCVSARLNQAENRPGPYPRCPHHSARASNMYLRQSPCSKQDYCAILLSVDRLEDDHVDHSGLAKMAASCQKGTLCRHGSAHARVVRRLFHCK